MYVNRQAILHNRLLYLNVGECVLCKCITAKKKNRSLFMNKDNPGLKYFKGDKCN